MLTRLVCLTLLTGLLWGCTDDSSPTNSAVSTNTGESWIGVVNSDTIYVTWTPSGEYYDVTVDLGTIDKSVWFITGRIAGTEYAFTGDYHKKPVDNFLPWFLGQKNGDTIHGIFQIFTYYGTTFYRGNMILYPTE